MPIAHWAMRLLIVVMNSLSVAAAAAFLASLLGTPVVRRLNSRLGLLDQPNARSSHDHPTPRSGGLIIVVGVAAALVLSGALRDSGIRVIAVTALLVAALGIADDFRNLPPLPKLIYHFVMGTAAVLLGHVGVARLELPWVGSLPLGVAGMVVGLLFLVWVLNLYNFMDGINGIAASQAVVAGAVLALLFARQGDQAGMLLAAGIGAASAGFLPWNFPRATIFLGDVGSTSLGFCFAYLVLRLAGTGLPVVAAVLPLFPFLFDATLTLILRMMRGEPFLSAHKLHIYQRLLQLGWTHTGVTVLYTGLAAASALAAIQYTRLGDAGATLLIAGLTAVHAGLATVVLRRTRHQATPPGDGACPAPAPSSDIYAADDPAGMDGMAMEARTGT